MTISMENSMDEGVETRIGLSFSDEKSSSDSDFVFPMKLQMSCNNQGENLERRFPGDAPGGTVSPAESSGRGREVVLGNTCRDDVSPSQKNDGENLGKSITTLQPFESCSTIPYKFPTVDAGMSVGPLFTFDQWKELQRQTMIYKYMISSLPVPPHLMFPLSMNFPTTPEISFLTSIYDGGYSRKRYSEPGRCKRTDGKKWRCSKDVAPRQKYCEHHLQRGRLRSRKPVEIKNNNNEKYLRKTGPRQSKSPSCKPYLNSNASRELVYEPFFLFDAKTDSSNCTTYLKGAVEESGLAIDKHCVEQPWQHLIEPNMGPTIGAFAGYKTSNPPLLEHDYAEFNISSYPNFLARPPEIGGPTRFIDAWSTDSWGIKNNVSLDYEDNHLSTWLDLSMATTTRDMLDESDDHGNNGPVWLGPCCCGTTFEQGGPLAEALHALGGSGPSSPHNNKAQL